MNKYEILYEYFQADMELVKYESELNSTETRKTLRKLQKYLQEGQLKLKNMEGDALVRTNELSEIVTQHSMMRKRMRDGSEELSSMIDDELSDVDLSYVKELIKQFEGMFETLSRQKKQIAEIKSYIERSNADIRRIVQGMQKAKKQFDELRVRYDAELKENAPEIERRKAELDKLASKVDADLIARYARIKRNRKDPVALVVDGKCQGCNMALPSGDLAACTKGAKTIECENCGRLLVAANAK